MKQVVCELCGSHKVIKKDGFYVCEECGTKYSLEEAKKLLKDVEVSPSDMLNSLKNLNLEQASKQEDVNETVNKYDQQALDEFETALKNQVTKDIRRLGHQLYLKDKNNPRFYVLESLAGVTEGTNGNIGTDMDKLANNINTAFDMELAKTSNKAEIVDFTMFVANNLRHITQHQLSCLNNYKNNINMEDYKVRGFLKYFSQCPFTIALHIQEKVLPLVPEVQDGMLIIAKQAIEVMHEYTSNYNYNESYLLTTYDFIKKYQPDYTDSIVEKVKGSSEKPSTGKSSGCYVATCIYGSYDCPEVWRLRRYRDDYLDSHWWGRAFIKIYYATSPTLVKWFGKKEWFRKPVTKMLERKLEKCKNMGYEDTPYNDKY